MACKEGQFDVVELMENDQFKTFSIHLNAQHVNGMTLFGCTVIRYSKVIIACTLLRTLCWRMAFLEECLYAE